MPIADKNGWELWVENNQDFYGKAIIDVSRRVMEILDQEPDDFDADGLIGRADKEILGNQMTGFMAGAVAATVSSVHSRGDEFRRKWNRQVQLGTEGDEANESGGILNPALYKVNIPD